MFNRCYERRQGELGRICWPDNGSYYDQPNVVIEMFCLLENVVENLKGAQPNAS